MEQENNDKMSFFDKIAQYCRKPLFILILITLGISAYLLNVQMRIGVPYWDVFNYLNTAMYFAGISNEGVTGFIYLPPLIPFLTSILFRMGYVSINAIFLVSSLMFIIGVIGFYLLLKERFNSILSFTGSLIFISLPVVISWATSGGIDIPGLSLSIWTIYFLVAGVKNNHKYLYLVLPAFILAFLARYTAGLIIIPILFYLLINLNLIKKMEDLKKIILWISVELAILITVSIYFLMKLGIISSILTLIMGVATSSSTGVGDVAYNPNIFYYLQNLLNYISISQLIGPYQQILNPSQGMPSVLAIIIALITILGILFYIHRIFIPKIQISDESVLNRMNIVKITVISILIISGIISFYYESFILSEIILLGILYLLYKFMFIETTENNYKIGLDLMFLSWFCAYFIFQGILPLKVDRYFITMAPALVYFIILGLSEFMRFTGPKIKNCNLRQWGIYLIVGSVFLSSATAIYIGHTPKKTFTIDIGNSSDWIKEYDPNYKEKVISSDYPNAVTWYLKKETLGGYPRFFNSADEFADYLQTNNVSYYIDSISNPHPVLKGYRIIKSFGVVVIYERIKT